MCGFLIESYVVLYPSLDLKKPLLMKTSINMHSCKSKVEFSSLSYPLDMPICPTIGYWNLFHNYTTIYLYLQFLFVFKFSILHYKHSISHINIKIMLPNNPNGRSCQFVVKITHFLRVCLRVLEEKWEEGFDILRKKWRRRKERIYTPTLHGWLFFNEKIETSKNLQFGKLKKYIKERVLEVFRGF